jgi:lipid-binding SYLF domain-containing protein
MNFSGEMSMKKTILMCVVAVTCAAPAFAALSTAEQKRLAEAATVLRELRDVPDKGISEELWNKAECVAVIPSLKKAALGIGGEYGRGVMSCKAGESWSAPLFLQLAKGSWGLQIGAQEIDLVLLVMNRRGVEKLLDNNISLGADASVAAGPVGRSANAGTDLAMSAEMLAYSRSHGAFAGIDISGGVLKPDKDANVDAYGESVKPHDVVFTKNVKAPDAARDFISTLSRQALATTGKK